ncbi:Protein GrpE [uncultured archaeon]|nr:Protein GrpE [uncultured archaeon]
MEPHDKEASAIKNGAEETEKGETPGTKETQKTDESAKQKPQESNEVEALKSVAGEYRETLQRLQAEFENFRKRNDKENEEFRKLACAKVIADFLPLMDSLCEGLKQAEKSGNAEMKEGFGKVKKQLEQILARNGVREIESRGKKYSHDLHEVLMAGNEKGKEEGVVLEEFQKGYIMNGKVLRPAKVRVNMLSKEGEKDGKQ